MLFYLGEEQRLSVALHVNGLLQLLLQGLHLAFFFVEELLAFRVILLVVVFAPLQLGREQLILHPQGVLLVACLYNVLLERQDPLFVRLPLALEHRLCALAW